MSDLANKPKSFFERPEGKTGLLFIFLGFIALIFAGNYIMPFIITAMANTLHAMLLIGVFVAVIGLSMNRRFQLLVSNAFKSTMRWLTGWFITIDPIGILKNYVETMQDRLDGIETQIMNLKGQMRQLQGKYDEGKAAVQKHMGLASAASKRGMADEMNKNNRMAAREKESAERFNEILQRMTKVYETLSKIKKNLVLLKEDTEHQVTVKEREYESIKAAYKAMSSAQKLIHGDKDKELFNESMEYIAEDVGNKLGEMDRFMELSQGFMTGAELQESVWNEEGMAMLEAWESGSNILDYEKDRGALPAPTPNLQTSSYSGNVPASVVSEKTNNNFDSLF